MSEAKSTVGPKIWVESVLNDHEYKACAYLYPNTYKSSTKPSFFKSDFEWRWRMGLGMTAEEIKAYTERINLLLTKVIKLPDE